MKDFFSSKYQAGYPGQDSQREKAERMFGPEVKGLNMNVPQSHSSKAQQNMRFYAEGGHAAGGESKADGGAMRRGGRSHKKHHHSMPDYQTNEHFPRLAKAPKLNVERFQQVSHMAEGGEAKRRGGACHKKHYGLGGWEKTVNLPYNPLAAQEPGRAANPGMRKGGHRKHYGIGGALLNAASPALGMAGKFFGLSEGGEAKRHGGRARHRAEGGEAKAAGGEMRRGGHRHCRAEGGKAAGGAYARGGNVYEREMLGEHPSHSRPHFNYESEMKGERCVKHSYADGGKAAGGEMAMGGVGKIRHNQATGRGQPINRRVNKDRTHY